MKRIILITLLTLFSFNVNSTELSSKNAQFAYGQTSWTLMNCFETVKESRQKAKYQRIGDYLNNYLEINYNLTILDYLNDDSYFWLGQKEGEHKGCEYNYLILDDYYNEIF